ncbi:MAG TPA: hypothetical protein DEA97_12280 [Bacteroidales bacterium]|nr:hypothetical protein [Bacteroidales bacterium]
MQAYKTFRMKLKYFILLVYIFFDFSIFGQSHYLSIGSKHSGLCFGNSEKYNGLRFNIRDKDNICINGINISAIINGEKSNGLTIGLLGGNVSTSNGLSVFGIYSDGIHNGISVTGLWTNPTLINGISISLMSTGQTYNGLSVAGWTVYADKQINGVAIAMFYVHSEQMNGLSLSLITSEYYKQSGVAISIFNKTEELHGFQFGLINYAGNNKKIFRWVPIINFNLRQKASN